MSERKLRGTCRVLYCLNVAHAIDLERAQSTLTAATPTTFHHKSRFPEGTGMSPPLRFHWDVSSKAVAGFDSLPRIEVAAYALGSLCITWVLPFESTLEELVALSAKLYGHEDLILASRTIAGELTGVLAPALERPRITAHIEDYVVFEVEPLDEGPASLLAEDPSTLARLLRAEEGQLSEQEVDDALASPVSYEARDLCLVDWLAAFLMGADTSDERCVLELANVELLELRHLDARLEQEIQGAYALLAKRTGVIGGLLVRRRELEQVARTQAEDALLHEGIDNALKLFGDDYLARLYRTSAQRFHFDDWDKSVQRKLEVLHSVYRSLADLAAHSRSEILEWIIIILIAIDIVIYFTPNH